ncbi:MAG TPA: hypothetical protein PKH16_09845 [Aequorivita sp.]|nr:hypothetical protein [Aequorivita sp.]
MKTKVTLLIIAIAITTAVKAQTIYYEQSDELYMSAFVDPTFTDRGFQLGVEVTFKMDWGFATYGISHYEELDPSYTDMTLMGGVRFNAFSVDAVTYYAGPRIGLIEREGNIFPLMGGVAGFDVKIDRQGIFKIGLRAWADYCADQDPMKYGGYTSDNWLIKDPMFRENGALVFTWRLTEL